MITNSLSHRDMTFLLWAFGRNITLNKAYEMAQVFINQYDDLYAKNFREKYQNLYAKNPRENYQSEESL